RVLFRSWSRNLAETLQKRIGRSEQGETPADCKEAAGSEESRPLLQSAHDACVHHAKLSARHGMHPVGSLSVHHRRQGASSHQMLQDAGREKSPAQDEESDRHKVKYGKIMRIEHHAWTVPQLASLRQDDAVTISPHEFTFHLLQFLLSI